MSDAISRRGTSAWLENMGHPNLAKMVMDEKRFPPVIFEPKRGKWIHISEEMWKCDHCGEISCCSPNFCPDCGADMREVTSVPSECEGDCGWCKPPVIEECKGVMDCGRGGKGW